MTHPRLRIAVGLVIAMAAGTWGMAKLNAQQPGFKRVPLQKQDLSVPGREGVVVRGEFMVGGAVGKHTHPGEELSYVLEGELSLEIQGKPAVTLKAGDVFFVPAGTVHAVKNTGKGPAMALSTYVVEKGKPLATPVPPVPPAPPTK